MLDTINYTQSGYISDGPPLHSFVEGHRDALRHAGELLLGYVGRTLIDNLLDRLERETVPSRATWRLLEQVRDMLTLRHVHDPTRPECGFFANIDPASPEVEQLCLLTDGLAAAMRATRGCEEVRV